MSLDNTIEQLEASLLDPLRRANAQFLEQILAEDFIEIGSSGRRYSKLEIVSSLPAAPNFSGPRTIGDFEIKRVTPKSVLALYQIKETGTLRSSLWRHSENGWEMVFHQGTPAAQV